MDVDLPAPDERSLDPHAFLREGGELGALIAAFDWGATPIGPISGWSVPMKTIIAFMLRSRLPIVTLWGETGVMIYNDLYRGFAGARHPALLGTNVLEGWHEVADFNANVLQKVYREGGTLSYKDQELTLVRDGTPRRLWTDLEYAPALDADGRPIGVIAIVTETTDRYLADRSLNEERRRLLQMAEQSPGFMALLEGPDHRIVMHNPAYQQVIGDRAVIGKTVAEALPDAVEQGFLDILTEVYRSGQPYRTTGARYEVQVAPGAAIEDHFIDFAYQPVRGVDGAVSGIFVSGVDMTSRTLAEAAMRASETQFRTFAQTAPNHIWTARPDGGLDWFNDRMLLYFGRGSEDLMGGGWMAQIHPEDREAAVARWAAARVAGDTFETQFRLRAADGVYRWHLARALPIRSDDERILRWIGTNTDIHEQKLAQAESATDRNRLWTMSRDLMLVCTFDGIITAANPSASQMLGWEEAEIIGRPITDFIHCDDQTRTLAEINALKNGVPTLVFENRYKTKAGDFRQIAWTAVADAQRIHAVGRDVTDERQLARDRERIWNLSPIIKIVTNTAGVIGDVNPSWSKLLGWDRRETIGRRTTDFMVEDEEDWKARVASLNAGQVLSDYRTVMRAKDGSTKTVNWMSVPESGTFYAFGRDVTSEIEAATVLAETEAALRQSQKMEAVGQLTGGIAHDFNNLLQGIMGSLEVIQRRIGQGRIEELDRFIAGAASSAKKAAGLTHRLLAFSRRQPLDPRPVDVNTLVTLMEDLFRRSINEKIGLDLALDTDLWIIRCDPNQLESALLNLVINARDAMPDGGRVRVATRNARVSAADADPKRGMRPGSYVCVTVSDTGVGMDELTMSKAFEPFFTTKPIGQGTGLGLSMIYGFAQQSEGFVLIDSAMGRGTDVHLYLPRATGDTSRSEPVTGPTGTHGTERGEIVLVVEDEKIVRDLIVEALNELGYSAIEATDGLKALDILQTSQRIDLLVTDVGLPGINGRQVADAARQLRPFLKILFMTGYAESTALASGFLEPGMEMITKPFAMDLLATRIRTMIEDQSAAS